MQFKTEEGLWVDSIVGMKGRKGLVGLHHRDWVVQLSIDHARELASILLQAAEAAEQEEFIFELGKGFGGKPEGEAQDRDGFVLLQYFREYRNKRREEVTERSHGDE